MIYLLYVLIGVIVFFAGLFVAYKIAAHKYNQRPKPDLYYDYYTKQDTTPEGKVGVFLVGLSMTDDFEPGWWSNIFEHVRHNIIPWPGSFFAGLDQGLALLDPDRFYEYEAFVPNDLVDYMGSRFDIDGIPFIGKYRRGEVTWRNPTKRIYRDHGFFLLKSHKAGVPSMASKIQCIAKVWYYGRGFKNKKVPHRYQQNRVLDEAFANLTKKYGSFPFHYADSMSPWEMHEKIYDLLEGGVDTIVLASSMLMYSHYEEFEGSWLHSMEIIRKWEEEHGNGKKIKVIMAPPPGHFPPIREGFIQLLKDRLDTLPAKKAVKVAVSVHGMPWDAFPHEAWLKLSPALVDPLVEDVKKLVAQYDFSKTEVVLSQDHFADPIWDPGEKYLSTNRAYLEGNRDGFDYVVQQPMEFYTENTDTMFSHAHHNYHHFEGYDVYETIDYPDWDVPYTRELDLHGTLTIYNGVLVGKYRHYVSDAFTQAMDSILSKSSVLQKQSAEQGQASADGKELKN